MNTNIMEALAVVLSELQRSNFTVEELSLVSELLSRQGFSSQEIAAAIDLLQRRLEPNARANINAIVREPSAGTWRILTRHERMMLSTEAEQILLQMQRTGIITALDVDNALVYAAREEERPVTRERIVEIVTEILFEKPPAGSNR